MFVFLKFSLAFVGHKTNLVDKKIGQEKTLDTLSPSAGKQL